MTSRACRALVLAALLAACSGTTHIGAAPAARPAERPARLDRPAPPARATEGAAPIVVPIVAPVVEWAESDDTSAVGRYVALTVEEKRRTDRVFALLLGAEMLVRKGGYFGPDGLPIPAYLFAPRDTTGGPYPVLLFVHGGVHGDFGLGHLHQVRDLVARGYLVVAPEYRGSTGYGRRHFDAIDYGGQEVDDVIAARDWLAREIPYADTARMGVLGYSHGGYIALFAVIRRPELFRVAVAHVPVAHLPTRMRVHGPAYEALFAAQPAYGGTLAQNPAPYLDRSPATHARKLRTPVLVHAADNDRDVVIAENRILRDSMVAAGKDRAGLYTYREWRDPPGGHSFGVLDTPEGREHWRETLAFLQRHLPAEAAGARRR